METDFLFSPNGILLFRDFILLVESGKSKFWKITLFLLEKPFFFLLFSDNSATANFIFPSSGNVFLNLYCIPVSEKGFSG